MHDLDRKGGWQDASQASQWWRWPLMPFAAVAGASLAVLAFALLNWFGMKFNGGPQPDGWYFIYVHPIFQAGLFGYIFASISYHVSPIGNVVASAVMTTLLCLVAAVFVVFIFLSPESSVALKIMASLEWTAVLVGCVAGIVQGRFG